MPKEKKGKRLKIDLACGNNLQKGFIGVDITKKDTQAKIEWDLLKFPWEFAKDNSVDYLWCSHFLEHIPHGNGYQDPLWQFMDEAYRILKVGGMMQILCPYYTSVRAFQDPTHLRFISEPMFLYFNQAWRKLNKLEHYPVRCNFEVAKIDHSVNQGYVGRAQEAVQQMATMNWNVVDDILVTLKKI